MNLRARLRRLEKLTDERYPRLPAAPPMDPRRLERLQLLRKRLVRMLMAALQLFGEQERETAWHGLRLWRDQGKGPYQPWLSALRAGRCRLPELPAAVFKEVLSSWLSPNVSEGVCVCRDCGLAYPYHKLPPYTEWKAIPGKTRQDPPPWYDLPCFFDVCPGCGASIYEMDWAHLVPERPWMAQDGCIR